MPNIIISYRRADTDAIAGRIRDRLVSHFGDGSVFMDIDSIPFGTDFREHIKDALAQTGVLIAVVGPKWLGGRKAGRFRIMDENDPVRVEIEAALRNGSHVIPVLVGGAKMPKPHELPETLRDFAFRNAADIDSGRDFHPHVQRLIRSIEQLLAEKSKATTAAVGAIEVAARSTHPREPKEPLHVEGPVPEHSGLAKSLRHNRFSAKHWAVVLIFTVAACFGGAVSVYVARSPQPAAPHEAASPHEAVQPPTSTKSAQSSGMQSGPASPGCTLAVQPTLAQDFKTVDPAWRLPTNTSYYLDDKLVMKSLEGKSTILLYAPLRFKDVSVCATIQNPSQINSPDSAAQAGVMFWATDNQHYYLASIFANGKYIVTRMADGDWFTILGKASLTTINAGPDAVNELQVSTNDNLATIYINGTKVYEFQGQPPKAGSKVGLFAASAANERTEWKMLNVAFADPDQPRQQIAQERLTPLIADNCKPLQQAAFADDFKSLNPGWGGIEAGVSSISDGEFVVQPRVATTHISLYPSLIFKMGTACARVQSPMQISDIGEYTQGALAFWGLNNQNYYVAGVFPDGRYGIYRRINGEWAPIVFATKSGAVRAGPGATNELMVVFAGETATLYVNAVKVWDFIGQPPKAGGSIGVFAESSKKEAVAWKITNVTVVEAQ